MVFELEVPYNYCTTNKDIHHCIEFEIDNTA